MEIPVSAGELAGELEYWLDDFKRLWRQRNKESELRRIEEMVLVLVAYLREKGGMDCA